MLAVLASQLSAYADEAGIVEMLGPTEWNCTASIGADGSAQMTVVPTGEVLPRGDALPAGSLDQANVASQNVGFEDPPGLAGDADPSGGEYPANSVMTYTHDPAGSTGNFFSSYFETCTLPYSQQAMCTAVLNDFASRYKDS